MKKIILSAFAAICALAMNAQVTLQMDNFTITAGESKTVTLNLNRPNDEEIATFSCKILFPEGITIDKKKNGKFNISLNDANADSDSFTLSSNTGSDGSIIIACFSPDATAFWGESGTPVVNIPITAASDLTSSTKEVKIYEQMLGDPTGSASKKYNPEDYIATVEITTAIESINGSSDEASSIYKLNGQVVNKAGRGVNIIKTKSGATKKVLNK